jgi:hypothetical protein
MASSKVILLILLVVSPKSFRTIRQKLTTSPSRLQGLVSDQVGYWSVPLWLCCLLLTLSLCVCRSRHFEHLRCFFVLFVIPISTHLTVYTFFGPSTTQNSEALKNRRDEVLRVMSSSDDNRAACGGEIRNIRTKKSGGLPDVNSDYQFNCMYYQINYVLFGIYVWHKLIVNLYPANVENRVSS